MKKFLIAIGLLLTPVVAFAQNPILNAVNNFGEIINALTPIIAGLALLVFFWGLTKYILNAGDENKKKEGRDIMFWGVIALFVMISVFGLVRVLQTTFQVSPTEKEGVPPSVRIR